MSQHGARDAPVGQDGRFEQYTIKLLLHSALKCGPDGEPLPEALQVKKAIENCSRFFLTPTAWNGWELLRLLVVHDGRALPEKMDKLFYRHVLDCVTEEPHRGGHHYHPEGPLATAQQAFLEAWRRDDPQRPLVRRDNMKHQLYAQAERMRANLSRHTRSNLPRYLKRWCMVATRRAALVWAQQQQQQQQQHEAHDTWPTQQQMPSRRALGQLSGEMYNRLVRVRGANVELPNLEQHGLPGERHAALRGVMAPYLQQRWCHLLHMLQDRDLLPVFKRGHGGGDGGEEEGEEEEEEEEHGAAAAAAAARDRKVPKCVAV